MQRKTLSWLHISDIHFREQTAWRENPTRAALLKLLAEQFRDNALPKPDLIFCTGDIAFGELSKSSMAQQYGYANDFFVCLAKTCDIQRGRIFLVPGNHDIDRKAVNTDAQEALNDKADKPREHETVINQRFEEKTREQLDALERLKHYGTFVEQQFAHQHDIDGRHVYAICADVNGLRVGIGGFNSAWSCAGPEDDRHIWLAAQWQFNYMQRKLEDADFCIGLMHHPVDWLNEAERDVSTRRIASNFHFWLHGHAHNAWVRPETGCITIAAGAVGAEHDDEFGVNLVELDLETKTGKVHLFRYSVRDNGWTISPVPTHAPQGVWPIALPPLPARVRTQTDPASQPRKPANDAAPAMPTPFNSAIRTPKLYGRDVLIGTLMEKSQTCNTLAIYGMRGNGKSELIQALLKQTLFDSMGPPLRINAHGEYRAADLFRQLAPLLGDTAEFPTPPLGSRETITQALKERYPAPRPVCIWIDRAHLLFSGKGWVNAELGQLFLACNQAFSDRLHWFFELRERPVHLGLLGFTCHQEEVPGLDRNSLAQYLREAAPAGKEVEWTYTGDELKRLYQWLGGGQGEQAHPLATRLLIEVALGKQLNPCEALTQLHREAQQRLEDALLVDLYQSVLSDQERKLLQAMSLYREPIPHDHADRLEAALGVTNAWARLDQRCLLPSDPMQQSFYLHGFIAEWVIKQLDQRAKEHLHALVAEAWLRDLNGTRRITQPNIQRANEAFHHLLCAQQHQRLEEINSTLFGPNQDWVCRQLWAYDERLFAQKAPIKSQQQVLTLITKIDPTDHKAWRFLGESLRKTEGPKSQTALDCFESAHRLDPSFPQYLANLGEVLTAQGRSGADSFLNLLIKAKQQHPESINGYVVSIEAKALTMTDQAPLASTLRQRQIDQGSSDPAFFAAEAEYQASIGNATSALTLLDLAEKRGCANEYTTSVQAGVLQKQGDGPTASTLRQSQIDQGSRNPAFYSAEAEYQASIGNAPHALALLDLAEKRGCTEEYITSIRAKIERGSQKI